MHFFSNFIRPHLSQLLDNNFPKASGSKQKYSEKDNLKRVSLTKQSYYYLNKFTNVRMKTLFHR
jgi:hypothetical protein